MVTVGCRGFPWLTVKLLWTYPGTPDQVDGSWDFVERGDRLEPYRRPKTRKYWGFLRSHPSHGTYQAVPDLAHTKATKCAKGESKME
jgi:hypothetical protein